MHVRGRSRGAAGSGRGARIHRRHPHRARSSAQSGSRTHLHRGRRGCRGCRSHISFLSGRQLAPRKHCVGALAPAWQDDPHPCCDPPPLPQPCPIRTHGYGLCRARLHPPCTLPPREGSSDARDPMARPLCPVPVEDGQPDRGTSVPPTDEPGQHARAGTGETRGVVPKLYQRALRGPPREILPVIKSDVVTSRAGRAAGRPLSGAGGHISSETHEADAHGSSWWPNGDARG
jgi:hypothetical protein